MVSNYIENLLGRLKEPYELLLIDEVIEAFASSKPDEADVAVLATRLAEPRYRGSRGSALQFADFVSTGGPTSLSTIVGPLLLLAHGYDVFKVTVPGRPAGSLDVLAQAPGYRFYLDTTEIDKCLDECGFAHVLAGHELARLDAAVFSRRQAVGKQAVPALVVASILSKKLAANVSIAGVEVRVSPFGNFGNTFDDACLNAKLLCRVADLLDMDITAFVVDGRQPLQPYIGRGEALLAIIEWLDGQANDALLRHVSSCTDMVKLMIGHSECQLPDISYVRSHFARHLESQGSSYDLAKAYTYGVCRRHSYSVKSVCDGYVMYDLQHIRQVLVATNAHAQGVHFGDICGVIIVKEPRSYVKVGETLMTFRCPEPQVIEFEKNLCQAVSFSELIAPSANKVEVIHA